MGRSTIWTTHLVQQQIDKLKLNIEADMGCFYSNDVELKDGNILFRHTQEELDEFVYCSRNIVYFVEKYCKFLTDKGRALVTLRDFQKEILDELGEEEWKEKLQEMGPKWRNYIMMASRQTGKTTTVAAFFAWYLCFHTDRNLLILANKEKTAVEIVAKVMYVFKGLPFFLKPGILNFNQTGMRLDNGCQLHSQATTKTASIGFTIHVLYADEFAHIAENIVDDFWRSVYPTLSASEVSQCIITSTPAGQANLFYEIWDKAVRGINSFRHKRVDWWQVPEHDDEWANKMKIDFGEDRFNQEFGLQFNSDSKLLLGAKELSFIKRIEKEYEFKDLDRTELDEELYRNLKWRPDFNPNGHYDPNKNIFVVSVDTGEGKDYDETKDNDYNVLSIYQLELKSLVKLNRLRPDEYFLKNMFRLRQVGLYRDNLKDEEVAAKVARAVVYDQLGAEACILVLEMNFNGKFFLDIFKRDDGYYDGIVLSTYHTKPVPGEKPPRRKAGFKVGNDKEHFCKGGRKLIRNKTMVPNDDVTVMEFSSFGRDKRGKFKGIGTHDDTVMATLNIARLYDEPYYEDRIYDILEYLDDSPNLRLIKYYLNIGAEVTESDISDDSFADMFDNGNGYSMPTESPDSLNEIFKIGAAEKSKYLLPANKWARKITEDFRKFNSM